MKSIKIFVLFFLVSFCFLHSQSGIPGYHQNDFPLTAPGAMGVGLYGYDNPALLNYLHQPDLMFTLSDATGKWADFNRWGLFAAIPHFGFGIIHQSDTMVSVNDYRLSLALGNRKTGFGIGYAWASGDTDSFNRTSVITLGSLLRPIPQVSLGLTGNLATSGGAKEGIIDLGVRPFGNERLTFFADYAIQNGEALKDGHWSTGVALEALPGVRLTGRYFDTKAFTIGLNFSLGRIGLVTQSHFDDNQEYSFNTYGIRVGAYDRNLIETNIMRNKRYVELNLLGPVKYQRFVMFDKSNTLAGLISTIDAAKKDPTISGIAINTSGMEINREMAWELREKLKDFKSTGKHVVIFIDNVSIFGYYFASIADNIVLDPLGFIDLKGLLLGRFYLKGALEKIGIGFDEWRFFKYKSAAEILSRENMSEGDREQLQELIDDAYRLLKSDICKSRHITPDEFEQWINQEVIFMPKDALAKGLVDSIGRWETVKDVIKNIEGEEKKLINPGSIAKFHLPKDDFWGEKPQIAVIYALGVCAMDEGITARRLVKDIESVMNNSKIKAMVLRVDSPGGDALASDLVAEAIRKCSEKKPVIISQGSVAASGGYWISMYGDTIVAAPNTITGSIGVIGGWIYNKGFKEKLGMSTDFVKVGKHADLEFGAPLPLIGQNLPDRNLTEEERAKMEYIITSLYKDFIAKVAKGRNKEYDEIESVAQGRVWSGYDGKEIGLVDVIGGLETAVDIAKEKAGISKDQEITMVELPKRKLLDPGMFKPKMFGVEFQNNEFINYLKFRLEHNGEPLPMLPMEDVELILNPLVN
jgi:protease-4